MNKKSLKVVFLSLNSLSDRIYGMDLVLSGRVFQSLGVAIGETTSLSATSVKTQSFIGVEEHVFFKAGTLLFLGGKLFMFSQSNPLNISQFSGS